MSSRSMRKRVVILGATGSIGENTLRVIEAHSDKLELVGVAARGKGEKLAEIARRFGVRQVGLYDQKAFDSAASAPDSFPEGTRFHAGLEGLTALATLPEADIVLVAVVGTTGLRPALAAIDAGKDLALASKEILVLAGGFVMEAARRKGVRLLPVDSEHNAVFQCIEGNNSADIARIVLTASGGAFRDWPAEKLAQARPEDALKHPNWAMGPKITVDSATLANKGLELIEAQWLFGLRPSQCQAVLHPQSIVHCLVEFNDGAMLAQLCPPSMTFPIQHALLHPERPKGVGKPLDLGKLFSLEFKPVDEGRFPMLRLARECMEAGGLAPAVYNAANEVAVESFLKHQTAFLEIPKIVDKTLASMNLDNPNNLEAVLAADERARCIAKSLIG